MTFMQRIRHFGRDVRGLSTVEYTVLLVLIVAGSVKLWNDFGDSVTTKLTGAHDKFGEHVK